METASTSCFDDRLAASADDGSGQFSPAQPEVIQTSANKPPASQPLSTRLRSFPITLTLIGINLVNFALMEIARKIWPQVDSLQWGADWGPLSLNHQWWRLLTATFIHHSLVNLPGNLVALWILGKRAEQMVGKWTFLLFYLSCGLAGSIAGLALHPESVVCGASAGVFGLAGGLVTTYVLKGLTLSRRQLWKLALLILWIGGNIYEGFGKSNQIDNAGHVAGLVTGLVLGAMLASHWARVDRSRRWVFSWMAALLFIGAIFVRNYNGYVIPLGYAMDAVDKGRADDALRELRAALQKRPDSFTANVLLAEIYLKKGDYPSAEAAVRRVLTKDSSDDHATYLLGMVELHTGRCREAHDLAAQQLIKHHNESHDASLLLMFGCDLMGTGELYLYENNPDLAIDAFQKALEQKPDYYLAQLGLARAYKAKGMLAEAAAAKARATAMRQQAQH